MDALRLAWQYKSLKGVVDFVCKAASEIVVQVREMEAERRADRKAIREVKQQVSEEKRTLRSLHTRLKRARDELKGCVCST